MGLYEAAKDALKVAQSVDNIELVQKLLDVQKMALDMQEKQQEQNAKILSLESEIAKLKELKKFDFADRHNYYIDLENPQRPLCPVCTVKLKSPVPLSNIKYCVTCAKRYE